MEIEYRALPAQRPFGDASVVCHESWHFAGDAAFRRRDAFVKDMDACASSPKGLANRAPEVLFNQRDWDGLRALLADDMKPNQSSYPLRVGRADVGSFFAIYAKSDRAWLVPAWLEGRISVIRDYRHVRYVADDVALTLLDTEAR